MNEKIKPYEVGYVYIASTTVRLLKFRDNNDKQVSPFISCKNIYFKTSKTVVFYDDGLRLHSQRVRVS